MNLAVLVSDYSTYEFEEGTLNYYPPCASCDQKGLPFDLIYNPPGDFGDIAFKYSENGDTLFYGTIVWMGHGAISYPTDFYDKSEFEWMSSRPNAPASIEYFDVFGSDRETFKAKADSAWQRVRSLDIVAEFAKTEYRVGIYMYPPSVGVFDPSVAKWVIFVYRGRSSHLIPGD